MTLPSGYLLGVTSFLFDTPRHCGDATHELLVNLPNFCNLRKTVAQEFD